jgi:hypothetical protein
VAVTFRVDSRPDFAEHQDMVVVGASRSATIRPGVKRMKVVDTGIAAVAFGEVTALAIRVVSRLQPSRAEAQRPA